DNMGILTAGRKIASIKIINDTLRDTAWTWIGTAFGGGGYFEAVIKFRCYPEQGGPAFWGMSLEHMANLTAGFWPGQAADFVHYMEVDIFDYHAAADNNNYQYNGILHDVFGSQTGGAAHNTTNPLTSTITLPNTNDFSQYHKYGCLWVPATGTTKGYVLYCFDDKATADSVAWTQYTDQTPPPVDPWTFGILDQQHLVLALGSDFSPMTIQSVNVWQNSDENNAKDGVIPPVHVVAVSAPLAGKTTLSNTVTFAITKETILITVGINGLYRLEIVRPNGAVAARLHNAHSGSYRVNRNFLPAGIYMLRATDMEGRSIAKLVKWQ
ncbi:MAG: hypothetical protein PHC61_17145, partial [Chitinivibrionales bacterium]|nr:hypothetical protein [Chitinivibrionales bacterium]